MTWISSGCRNCKRIIFYVRPKQGRAIFCKVNPVGHLEGNGSLDHEQWCFDSLIRKSESNVRKYLNLKWILIWKQLELLENLQYQRLIKGDHKKASSTSDLSSWHPLTNEWLSGDGMKILFPIWLIPCTLWLYMKLWDENMYFFFHIW